MKLFAALIFIAVVESARLPQMALEETESIPDSVTDVSEIPFPVGEFQLLPESDLSSGAEETSEGIVTGSEFELEQRRRPWSRPNSFGRPPYYGSSPYLMRPPFNHQFIQSPYPLYYSHRPIMHSFYPVVPSPFIWPGHPYIRPTYPEMSTTPESTTEAATFSDPVISGEPDELTTEEPTSELPEDLTTEEPESEVPEDLTPEQPESEGSEDLTPEQPESEVPEDLTPEQPESEVPEDLTPEQPESEVPEEPSTQPELETAQFTTEPEALEPNLANCIENIFQLPLFGNLVQLADNLVQKPLSANFALNIGRQ